MPAAADPPILIRRRLFPYFCPYDADFACLHRESPYECLARVPSSSASTAGPREPYAEGEQYHTRPVKEPFGDTLLRGRACQAKPHEREAVWSLGGVPVFIT